MEKFNPQAEVKKESNEGSKFSNLMKASVLSIAVLLGAQPGKEVNAYDNVTTYSTDVEQVGNEILQDGKVSLQELDALKDMAEKLRGEPISYVNPNGETVEFETPNELLDLVEEGLDKAKEVLQSKEQLTQAEAELQALYLKISNFETEAEFTSNDYRIDAESQLQNNPPEGSIPYNDSSKAEDVE